MGDGQMDGRTEPTLATLRSNEKKNRPGYENQQKSMHSEQQNKTQTNNLKTRFIFK